MKEEYYHSVTLDKDKCQGCTNCIKRCPTEAIRVQKGKAKIIKERCIDCGECIRICPHKAKKAITDPLDLIFEYKYKIAIPAPALYGQFNNIKDVNLILTGLKYLGFDHVHEVAHGAEEITRITRELMAAGQLEKPVISSACPAILRLITVRFPELIPHVIPVIPPVEAAAIMAKREFCEEKKVPEEEVGVFFISPCAAKVTAMKSPMGLEKSNLAGVISIAEVYLKLLPILGKIEKIEPLRKSSFCGIGWARSGGEGNGIGDYTCIAVDGVDNVIKVLEELDGGQLRNIDFIEASACIGGCVGGPLNVENTFVASAKVKKVAKLYKGDETQYLPHISLEEGMWNTEVDHNDVMNLDANISEAMKKMELLKNLHKELPGLDCGSCGAPSCYALAEDIVRGFANESDCVFKLREKVRELAREMIELEEQLPPSLTK